MRRSVALTMSRSALLVAYHRWLIARGTLTSPGDVHELVTEFLEDRRDPVADLGD